MNRDKLYDDLSDEEKAKVDEIVNKMLGEDRRKEKMSRTVYYDTNGNEIDAEDYINDAPTYVQEQSEHLEKKKEMMKTKKENYDSTKTYPSQYDVEAIWNTVDDSWRDKSEF